MVGTARKTAAQRVRAWKKKNPAKVSAQRKRWRTTHHDQDIAERLEVARERHADDPEYLEYMREKRAYRKELVRDLQKHGVPPLIVGRLKEALTQQPDIDAEISELMEVEEDE